MRVDNERASKRAKTCLRGTRRRWGEGRRGGQGVVCRRVGGVCAMEKRGSVQSAAGAHTGRLGGHDDEDTGRCSAYM